MTRQTSEIPSTRFNAWKELGRQTTQTTDTSQTIQTTQTTYMNIMTKDNHIKKKWVSILGPCLRRDPGHSVARPTVRSRNEVSDFVVKMRNQFFIGKNNKKN